MANQKAKSLISRSSNQFVCDLETPHGRPDAVLFNSEALNSKPIERGVKHSPGVAVFATILWILKESRGPLNGATIERLSGLSSSYVGRTLRSMRRAGVVSKLGDGRYVLDPAALVPRAKIVSIEFKLTNWRKALKQAFGHRAFADEAFVIMPAGKRALLSKRVDRFAEFGVSVGVYDAASDYLEILHRAKSKRPPRRPYIDILCRLWAS